MALTTSDRLKELQRMVKWTQENREIWELAGFIITGDIEVDEQEYKRVFAALLEAQFYQVLFLMFSASDSKMEAAVGEAYKALFVSRLDEQTLCEFTGRVLENISEEIARQ